MHLMQIHEPGETPAPHKNDAIAVGIDLGTTHSVVAISREGKVQILEDEKGRALLPSAVYYAPDGSVIVGKEARAARNAGSSDAVISIKRRMGQAAERMILGGKERTPVEISADILRELKKIAEKVLGKQITQAVITVPAYFDDGMRLATKDAARLAGLEVLRLINEPTAAALAYGLDNAAEGIYAVYDLGGGTFDISVLKLERGVFQVLSTGGDTALGGDDIDEALARNIATEHNVTLTPAIAGEWLAVARQAKENLSSAEQTEIQLSGGLLRLERSVLNRLALPLIERTLGICASTLSDADVQKSQIQGVILVGGSTRMPLVRESVEAFFGTAPLTNLNPDEVVAAGAALQAEALTQGSSTLLLDVVPLSLGLETMGGIVEKIIHRNTPIPTSFSQEFTTYQDNQTGMQMHVLQGEREMVDDNRSLARFELKGIPPLPAGIARVKVDFTVDADGLLTVSAEEAMTGERALVEVRPSYGLPPEEIERMLLESMQYAREDITARLLAEARMEAERNVIEVESALKVDGDLLSDAERKLIALQIGYVREAIAGDDRERIDVEVQQLAQGTQGFAEKRMNRAVEIGLRGKSVDRV